jgi:hypothetical protein
MCKISKFILFFLLPLVISCSGKRINSLEPIGYDKIKTTIINNGDLKAVFIDNTDLLPNHKSGYNGIAELYHKNQDSTLFVPAYAGFNLEHVFSGDSLVQFFEPRVNPMTLYKKSNNEVLLYQKQTPVSGAESLTEFKLVPPCYIDVTFRCILHDIKYFRHGYAGFFWASYINKPSDKNIYFRGLTEGQSVENWISAFTETHGLKSTHKDINDKLDLYFASNFNATLAKNYSDYHYSLPFYYGRFHNMVLAYLFKTSEILRLTQSPDGGGTNNPAWDFQYIIPEPVAGKEYSFKVRMIYKPFINAEDIEQEYERWK